MKNLILKTTLTASIAFMLAACSPESQTLGVAPAQPNNKFEVPKNTTLPRQEFGWITEDGGQSNQEFNP